jgi:hypothetical protein
MGNQSEIIYVPGSDRFKGNTDKDLFVQVPLQQDYREFIEGDRSVLLNLEEIFDFERQLSQKFRVAGKITNLFNNTVSGKTTWNPFKNNLFYLDSVQSVNTNIWIGYPQGREFSFFRSEGLSGQTTFVPKSASSYNYNVYLSYAYSGDQTQKMYYRNEELNVSLANFTAGDGVPFAIENKLYNGKPYIYFKCGTAHNLQVGQWVELSFVVNGTNLYQVYDIGDESYGSEQNVFALYNIGYTGFSDGTVGNFKRIVDIQNSGETKSKYYVRLHKILTDAAKNNLTTLGFERNVFTEKKKLEYSALTPNNVERISEKNDTRSYSFSFPNDIDITGLLDSNKKPIKELFVTVIQKGYMGWFNKPYNSSFNTAIDIGWGFNFERDTLSTWWNHASYDNKDNIPVDSYTVQGNTFYYNKDLLSGHTIKGDFCEYNEYEQQEYLLSNLNHKFSYNLDYFNDDSTPEFPSGYAYQPHYSIPIRAYSSYIENAIPGEVDNVPDYAYFSEYYQNWVWRDLYPYGFTDADGFGVDIPFINGAHYPFSNIMFLQVPMLRNNNIYAQVITQPIIDDCEQQL